MKPTRNIQNAVVLILCLAFVAACASFDPLNKFDDKIEAKLPAIWKVYEKAFAIGAAVEPYQLTGAEGALLRRHYNSLTAENAMKFLSIHPKPDSYEFGPADEIAAFARRYGMTMRGHTFVWHHPNEIADWMFFNADGSRKTREAALAMLEDHIRTLMGRYGDVVSAWDVVNEAIDMDQPDTMRRTPWYETVGPDYVAKAFEIAHKIDSKAKLFYNDYMTFDSRKGQAIFNLISGLIEKGVPIHGIGMQMHITLTYPELDAVKFMLMRFKQLGLEINITELDMSLYTQEFETLEAAPDEYLIRQGHRYRELFELFAEQKEVIGCVTTWGFNDGHTWLTGEPHNRRDWPLAFGADLKAKLAYQGIVGGELPPDVDLALLRPQKVYTAPKGTPLIDGVIDELWSKAEVVLCDTQVMSKPGATGKVRSLWDEKRLYFLAEVTDPLLNAKNSQRHEQDSFEVFIDENNGKTATFESNDYQYRANFEGRTSYGGRANNEMMEAKATLTATGYIVELAVSLNTITGRSGALLGMDFQVNDADGSGKRVGITKWNDPTNESWRNTSMWGTLVLGD